MEQLEVLPPITRLSENVIRVLGQNPGKFTLQGTNTYLIGKRNPRVLIDTGEGLPGYLPYLEEALRENNTDSSAPDVSDIVISHWHHDHLGGLPSVLSLLRRLWSEHNSGHTSYTPPRLHKFPLPSDAMLRSQSHGISTLDGVMDALVDGTFSPTPEGAAFHDLYDKQVFEVSDSHALRVFHTPGHTIDSICLHIPDDHALYTSDSVLGQGTAVFEDLSTYLTSLHRMQSVGGCDILYPGHGPVLQDGARVIDMYIQHRLEREAQILAVLRSPPPGSHYWTTWSLVSVIYASYPESLWLPAARGVDLHLKKLAVDGVVRHVGGEDQHSAWEMLNHPAHTPDALKDSEEGRLGRIRL
ncbi:lactamase [Fistulina hepatica ATCC 64428]|uniref:Lactamase n=1 Tax=Fistulina hepatica ATCC 64428 TaxID=1128425 RepID=A0A0D7AEG8_9AGAR|nr:lactamase [Fistulina hepatica ATCC 64428]